MTTANEVYEATGDVTAWFRERAKDANILEALDAGAIVSRVEVDNPSRGEPMMNRLIGAPPRRVGVYRITLPARNDCGITWQARPETFAMPRDVWMILRGIGMALRS